MEEEVKSWQTHLKEAVFIFGIGMVSNLLFCPECLLHLAYSWHDFVFTGLLWVGLWKGNEWVAEFPNKYISWKERPTTRMIVGLLGHIIYSFLASVVLLQLFEFALNGHFRALNLRDLVGFNLTVVVISVVISLFLTARSFLFSWRDLAVEHEKLKVESMASRFASLKAQVNPHFLFNSLNVLSGLVYQDADLSAQFIKKLSEVYRYVLDRQEEELVSLSEELEFVASVVFLQKIRFGENLKVSIDISANEAYYVPPVALQMLLENAIKHNAITTEKPLEIQLKTEGDYLVVSNTLQPKMTMKDSLGIGLENIRRRYGFLTNKPVEVIPTDGAFIVKLPLIVQP